MRDVSHEEKLRKIYLRHQIKDLFRGDSTNYKGKIRSPSPSFSNSTMAETAATNTTLDTQSRTATPEEIAVALSGVTPGRTFPVTLPECPHCKKKNVTTKLDTHATSGTYAMCVVSGIFSALVLWWIPLVLDSVRFIFNVQILRYLMGNCSFI
jgi:hypothetical protein